MRIHVVGGGPAGLYFALLMKARDPRHDVVVRERNPRGSTFGWGVVFSDRTLGYLRDADEPSHDAIRARFATWETVEILKEDSRISIGGNKFSGIARLALLDILERRCEALGVEVRHEDPVADLEGGWSSRGSASGSKGLRVPGEACGAGDCDLLVGADGVNSGVRAAHEAAFEPSLDARANRYIWFGTPQPFRGLTLTFRAHDAGVFIAHSYRFDATTSTFIVECDPATFERAGLERRSDEETRALLAGEVFREDLGGAPLLSNASKWIRFVVVRNRKWHAKNVVLLGDALHTVHFSIGSGTKLALEDAIALARAFDAHPRDVPAALAAFEAARKPVVDEYQEAGEESLAWFENARSRMALAPIDFAMSCMTRSKKIDLDVLRRRDPAFVARWERERAPHSPQ